MLTIPDCPASSRFLALFALLAAVALPALAQRTVVQQAGGGRKIELHYNAAGKITETRTLNTDGQLLQKQVLEYLPGAYVPQTTSTSYWPNGKVHRIARDTYDNNANFTGEFVQLFDEAGKQIAGTQVNHYPRTNTYHCARWNPADQTYQDAECPAGEESSGGSEQAKKFTLQEVMQQLASARRIAQLPLDKRSLAPHQPVDTASKVMEVGLVLPSQVRPGVRVSGSVVENPSDYEGTPGITVTPVSLPLTSPGAPFALSGWTVELPGHPPQPADQPIVLTISSRQAEVAVLFRQKGSPESSVSKTISIPRSSAARSKRPASYLAPAICVKHQPCEVRGPFSGDSSQTFAAFGTWPAQVLAETPDTAYLAIPDRTEPGTASLVIAHGQSAVAFPTVVVEFTMPPDRRNLSKGETLLLYPTLEGPEELPDALWAVGNFPASNLAVARELIPGFELPHPTAEPREPRELKSKKDHADRDSSAEPKENSADKPEEGENGEILLVVKNLTPGQVTCRESENGSFVFHLKPVSFQRGEFQYKFVVEAGKTGNFAVQGYVIPFLAPLPGQEFTLAAGASGK
jgi:hypothetical protein